MLACDLVKILEQAEQDIPEFLVKLSRSMPSSNQLDRPRNAFGGLDMRNRKANRRREPAAHEPVVDW